MSHTRKWMTAVLCSLLWPSIPAQAGSYELIKTHRGDDSWYTQGFEQVEEGKVLITSGRKGESKIGILSIETGKIEVKDRLSNDLFGEGVTQTPDAIWHLTYKAGKAFKRDLTTYQVIEEKSYQGEGWGIAYDKTRDVLWMTNGSSKLQKRDSKTFELLGEQLITYQGKPIERLNELEVVNGTLYANIYLTNTIVTLNPETGVIGDSIDLSPLLQEYQLQPQLGGKPDVLNGIAHVKDDVFYITGKYYPYVFEVRLKVEQPS